MIVVVEQLLLDLHDLGVEVDVGVGPGPVEVLSHQVTSRQVRSGQVCYQFLVLYQFLRQLGTFNEP